MGANVFGTPITKFYVKGMEEYCNDRCIGPTERAQVALQRKNAEGKDVAAKTFLKQLRDEFGNKKATTTMCLVYNATGDPVTFVAAKYWDGSASESHCPTIIANGQWGAFLCTPSYLDNKVTAAFIYRAKPYRQAVHCATAFATSPGHKSVACADIWETNCDNIGENGTEWVGLKEKLLSGVPSTAHSNQGVSMYTSIGSGDNPMLEVVLTMRSALTYE